MYDNRIISSSEYVVTSVTSATTDNRLTKRPYTRSRVYLNKKQKASNSFDDTVHSAASHNLSNDTSPDFSNELENKLRLQSEENARLAQLKFNQDTANDFNSGPNPNSARNVADIELHNKLSQAMDIKVDTSILSKKINLLNSLRDESND